MVLIAPSILSANFLELGNEIDAIVKASADYIHIDVMDGHFVPNLTMGPPIIRAIKKMTKVPLDVHLMIEEPEAYLDAYAESGADILTIHVESCIHLERAIRYIKSLKIKAGVALNPSTHERSLEYVIDQLDLILVMSVNPGFGGQTFLPSSIKKIAAIKAMLADALNPSCIISVDGGITDQTAAQVKIAGATCLVAGNYIFGAGDYGKAIEALRKA